MNIQSGFIRESLQSGFSFFAYRLPHSGISFGRSSKPFKGLIPGGFVIAPFDLESGNILTIVPETNPADGECSAIIPKWHETTRGQHNNAVNKISLYHRKHGGKTVLSRMICAEDVKIDCDSLFAALCKLYPEATVFCFRTPETGLWIGASPERLLSSHDGTLTTMALAGTRRSGTKGEWDIKNIEEHALVADFIVECLSECKPCATHPYTRNAGPVEHLCCDITAKLPESADIEKILRRLSPTPALCGSDRSASMRLIQETESHERGCYGGFFGPYHSENEFDFFVNLRSMNICGQDASLIVGGGITALSSPDTEWEETNIKSRSVLNALRVCQSEILSKFDK